MSVKTVVKNHRISAEDMALSTVQVNDSIWSPQLLKDVSRTGAKGDLTVTIKPEKAAQGTRWSIKNQPWKRSGERVSDIPADLYSISVNPASGWRIPIPTVETLVTGRKNNTATVELIPVGTFSLGSIPNQTFRAEGSPIEFAVNATELTGPIMYSVSASPTPQGTCCFVGDSNHFRFNPGTEDQTSFTVTITAQNSSGKQVSQEIPFTPMVKSVPEASSFGVSTQIKPEPYGIDYRIIKENVVDLGDQRMNYSTEQQAKEIEVSAPMIIIENTADNVLRGYSGNRTIKSMTIATDTLVVKMRYHLPQTNVEIWAREIIFEDPANGESACIDVSPITVHEGVPAEPLQEKKAANGLDAGTLKLHIQEVRESSQGKKRFILNGGAG